MHPDPDECFLKRIRANDTDPTGPAPGGPRGGGGPGPRGYGGGGPGGGDPSPGGYGGRGPGPGGPGGGGHGVAGPPQAAALLQPDNLSGWDRSMIRVNAINQLMTTQQSTQFTKREMTMIATGSGAGHRIRP